MIPHLITHNGTLTASIKGKMYSYGKECKYYDEMLKAIRDGDAEEFLKLVDLATKIANYSHGACSVKNGILYLDDKEVTGFVAKRIIFFMEEKLPYAHIINFVRRLRKNPSYSSTQQLFGFLDANHHPILEDGRFMAYKKVTHKMKDCHTRTIDNSVGQLVRVPRNEVDDNSSNTCSYGLHVAAYKYASNFSSGVLVEVAVDPADVVAVPPDYNQQKMRCCAYEVMGICMTKEETAHAVNYDRWSYDDCDYDDDCDDDYDDEDYI